MSTIAASHCEVGLLHTAGSAEDPILKQGVWQVCKSLAWHNAAHQAQSCQPAGFMSTVAS